MEDGAPGSLKTAVDAVGGPAPGSDLDLVADGFLSVDQFCRKYLRSRASTYEDMQEGRLRYALVGRSRRIPVKEAQRFAAACLVPTR